MEEIATTAELGYYEQLVVDTEDIVQLDYERVAAELGGGGRSWKGVNLVGRSCEEYRGRVGFFVPQDRFLAAGSGIGL